LIVTFVLNVFEPVKVWLALSKATFADSRVSANVPLLTLEAFNPVRPAPLPVKLLAALLSVF
jgi:hypothetical protein